MNDISATGISLAFGIVSHDAITLMLKTSRFGPGQVTSVAVNLATRLTGEGWVVIDDTLIPKIYAKLIGFCFWDFDHALGRNVFGIRIVFIVWSNGIITIPLAFCIWQKAETAEGKPAKKPKGGGSKRRKKRGRKKKPGPKSTSQTKQARYQRQRRREIKEANKRKCRRKRTLSGERYRTKNELARILVWQVVRAGIDVHFILLDNWYAGQKNLRFFERLGLSWVTRLKSNQKVIFQGKWMTVQQVGNTAASYS